MSTMLTFSIFSIIFLAIGIVLYVLSEQIFENSTQYDSVCHSYLQLQDERKGELCVVPLDEITDPVKGPVYVYYQLDNFYQNHRRYVKSRDSNQLNGKYVPVEKLTDCDPIITNGDLWRHQHEKNLNGKPLKLTDPAIPCGLVAKSLFNDTFLLKKKGGSQISIDSTNIAWSSDIQYKFKNIEIGLPDGKGYKDIQWHDM